MIMSWQHRLATSDQSSPLCLLFPRRAFSLPVSSPHVSCHRHLAALFNGDQSSRYWEQFKSDSLFIEVMNSEGCDVRKCGHLGFTWLRLFPHPVHYRGRLCHSIWVLLLNDMVLLSMNKEGYYRYHSYLPRNLLGLSAFGVSDSGRLSSQNILTWCWRLWLKYPAKLNCLSNWGLFYRFEFFQERNIFPNIPWLP